jgi:hypothetical protein
VRIAYSTVWNATEAGSWPGAERVGRADHDRAIVVAEELRELADGRGLADAVDADHQHDGGPGAELEGGVEGREALLQRLAEHALEVGGVGRRVALHLRTEVVDDLLGDVGAEVGADQRLLQVVPRGLVDRLLREHATEGTGEGPGGSHALSLFAVGGGPTCC